MLPQLPLEIAPSKHAGQATKSARSPLHIGLALVAAVGAVLHHIWLFGHSSPFFFWTELAFALGIALFPHLLAIALPDSQLRKFSMRLDEQGLTLHTQENSRRRTIHWNEMHAFSIEDINTKGQWGRWATLWGANETVLLEWPNFYYIDTKSLAEIELYLHHRVNRSTADTLERNRRVRLWATQNPTLLHPLSDGSEIAMQAKNRTTGYGIAIILAGLFFGDLNYGAGKLDTFAITVTTAIMALGVVVVFFAGSTLRVSPTVIEINNYYERYRLKWEDVTSIKTDIQRLVFESGEKRLVFTNMLSWRSAHRLDVYFWILAQAQQRGISVERISNHSTWESSSSLRVSTT